MQGAPWGGSEELWSAVAKRALDEGWQVMASTHRWPQMPIQVRALQQAGALVLPRRPRTKAEQRVPRLARNALPSLRRVARWRPNVLVVNQGGTYDLTFQPDIVRDLSRMQASGVPVMVLCHGADDSNPPSPGQRVAARGALGGFDRVLFTCQAHLRQTERHLGRPLPGAGVFQNPLKVTERLSWPKSRQLQLATMGRLWVLEKGQDVLLEALSQVSWRGEDWHLDIYGEGPDKEYLEGLTTYLGLNGHVTFAGHSDPRTVWSGHHVLMQPSRREGMPLTVLEAMSAQRPALVTDISGLSELVSDDENGFIAPAPTSKSLAHALERLWANRERLAEMGQKAAERVEIWRSPDPPGQLLADLAALILGSQARDQEAPVLEVGGFRGE